MIIDIDKLTLDKVNTLIERGFVFDVRSKRDISDRREVGYNQDSLRDDTDQEYSDIRDTED